MKEVIINILLFTEIIILAYFTIFSAYFFIFSLASKLYWDKKTIQQGEARNISILIPAYKEDSVILETTASAVSHKSNIHKTEVIVIADSLKPETVEKLKTTGATILVVEFEKSTKVKSLNQALNKLSPDSHAVLILDADNIMAEDFTDRLMQVMDRGYRVVQGHRTAKNDNTPIAVLDGISEEVNNSIFRKGQRVFGLSSSIIGSGFICETALIKEMMSKLKAVGGFDKEMELALLEAGIPVAYANNALVYDEKVQQTDVFVNQRRRWLSAQFIFFSKSIPKALKLLFLKGNIGYFNKCMQFIMPPRIITLGLSMSFLMLHLLLYILFPSMATYYTFLTWTGIFLATSLAIFIGIPGKMYNRKLFMALLHIPKGFLLTMLALFKLKGADNKFIHTKHGIDKKT